MFWYFEFWPYRAAALPLAALALVLWVMLDRPGSKRFRDCVSWLTRRPGATTMIVFAVSLLSSLALTVIRYPQPTIHDEFAYQLAADTYANFRLTNPTHPHWRHFETFHVLSQPSYMAKYPPGNGLILGLGQLLTNHSIVGSWLALALAIAATHWMLRVWIPPRWAVIGSLLLAIQPFMLLAWGQTWWGGGVQMLGGALVFGAMKRLTLIPKSQYSVWQQAIIFSIGAVLLALSRPMEGLLACSMCGVAIGFWAYKRNPLSVSQLTCQLALPMVAIGATGVAFLLYNNHVVSGDAAKLPYAIHSQQYSATSMLIWDDPPELPKYNLPRMEDMYVNWSRARQFSAKSLAGFTALAGTKLNALWCFFPLAGGVCLMPVFLISSKNQRWLWMAAAGVTFIILLHLLFVFSYAQPHYVAPFACLFYVLVFHGMRCWHVIGRRWPVAKLIIPSVGFYTFASYVVMFVSIGALANDFSPRAKVEAQLQSLAGEHLVLIDYAPNHNIHREWVYNKAIIDDAKIVWANLLEPEQNQDLLNYFSDRTVWIWDGDGEHQPVDRSRLLNLNKNIQYRPTVQP